MQLNGNHSLFSLYFHVPFCSRKCDYCHFYVIPDQEHFKAEYMEALFLEWKQKHSFFQGRRLASIYFGGGTPALLGAQRIATILSWICPDVSCVEITLEANPENVTLDLMKAYRDAGINRVSIGVQTFDENLLRLLGRTHDAEQAAQAVAWSHAAGFHNISIDLMYDLPTQTLESWEKTLTRAFSLPISHLSLYNLTIEPHTVFYKKRASLQKQLPDDDASLSMLQSALLRAPQAGLHRYEISAFAKTDLYSRHNTGYWTGRPFLGLGPAAFSFWEGSRFRNIPHLHRYAKDLKSGRSPTDFTEKLSSISLLKEQLAIQLRLLDGILIDPLSLPIDTQRVLQECVLKGWMKINDKRIQLTEKGLLFHDWIASELVEDSTG